MALTKNEVNILDRMADLFGLHNVAIGGGYARDTYFGEQPKDIDVVLCMQHDSCPEELVAKLCGVFEANGYSYRCAKSPASPRSRRACGTPHCPE